ncbi:hypothetical protein GA0070610_1846 [Micromonospora echinofusca]|uniref:Uncharacterized protein n=1 Tax=Micromonospora echinofusca TaxID=47858 RepID=A0A1C5G780_MICEH|nr:hypothetical protein [Micromonospora echinofusca]SCG15611.1 hypothetical protein GA0070610_1846 [Micromonospora echinofusca]
MGIDINVETWGPAVLAIGSAGVAVWAAISARSQADSAKRQAKSAEVQAEAARDSAATAQRQALAAEEQLALARRQFQAELVARDESDGPEFRVDGGLWHCIDEQYAEIPIKLLSGKPLDAVVISVAGQPDVRGFVGRIGGGWDGMQTSITRRDFAPGAASTLVLMLEWKASMPLNVRLDFECHEGAGGSRTWHRSYSSQVNKPPEQPATSGFRRRPFGGR